MSVTGKLAEIERLSDYPSRVAVLLRELIAADHAGYNEIDLSRGAAVVIADPPDAVFDGGPEILARYGHQNRLLAHHASVPESRALRLSDFMSSRELHRTEIYDLAYRHIPLEYQLAVGLPPPNRNLRRSAELVGLSLGRERRDFTAADQRLLWAMRPHFAATLDRLQELALAQAIVTAADRGPALALVDHDEVVVWRNTAAGELGLDVDAPLPPQLRAVDGRAVTSLDGRRVRASRIASAYPGLDALRLQPLPTAPNADALRAAGLTGRQAEVLALATAGRSTRQIAEALALSPRSVEKDFERIYARLGVSNRTQAVLRALALRDHPPI
jgi:DNA-binding CsgD family transcriptional regulator